MNTQIAVSAVSASARMKRLRLRSGVQRVIGLAAVLLIALVASPHSVRGGLLFLEPGNISDILRQVSEIGIISLGMTFVILTGGIDLSVSQPSRQLWPLQPWVSSTV